MGHTDLRVDQGLFRNNIARVAGGAIYFGAELSAQFLIQSSIFEANAVRPPLTNEKTAAATVVTYTLHAAFRSTNPNKLSQNRTKWI